MKATIQILGTDLLCRCPGSTTPEQRLDGAGALPALKDWASRYEAATRRGDALALLDIGRGLFNWLNPAGWAEVWARAGGPRQLDIIVDDPSAPLARALLDAPWELLASAQGHLADDSVQLFELARRIGLEAAPLEPRHADVQLLFMAAAPRGETALSFEAEETSILDATQRLPLHLVVEESGASAFLGERLDLDGPFEALHLSCHGDIHPTRGPVLALEDETGALALTDVGQLIGALGEPQALPLVFLSACRTAEQLESGTRSTEPFVRELVRAGIANVLGWDGSVYDTDALSYARSFYGELASLHAVPRAAAIARHALRQQQLTDPQRGRHWHLARLYLGPCGGGKLAAKGKPKRKPAGGEEQFLDAPHHLVPVAGRNEFVGRRRATQEIIRAFRDGCSGVLVHGMGNLGKSSLAYRIATRHPRHEKVVVFGKYDALAIFDRLAEALPAAARRAAIDTWRDTILANPAALAEALETLLEGPFDTAPILLVIDDLERILEAPTQTEAGATPVQAEFRAPLAAVINAFQRAQTESRLLITSRYRFTLPTAQGGDLAEGLAHVPLQPMDEIDRRKQLRAAARLAQKEGFEGVDADLLQRALQMAEGNPGLQATLTRPILAGEAAVAHKALADIEHFQQCGVPPADIQALIDQGVAADAGNATVAFFTRMAFDTYRQALTSGQAEMLRAACLFSPGLPIPRPAVEAAGRAAGVPAPAAALDRLIGLGLADDWGQAGETALVAANPLARALAGNLDEALGARLADAALPELDRHWREAYGSFPLDLRSLETARLALAATAPSPATLDDASTAAARVLFDVQNDARQALETLLKPALKRLETLASPASASLLLVTADCAERLADAELLDQVLEQSKQVEGDPFTKGSALLRVGRRHTTRGDLAAAQSAFRQAAEYFDDSGAIRNRAIAISEIADIHHARGELDEALRIRIEEQLPVFDKLGDVRERALSLGKIADIHFDRGELDKALHIRIAEEMPVYEKLGDVRSRAVALCQIVHIYHARGELDDAQRILTEELLPVFEKLGDVRERAFTLSKIADIHHARGELDAALRIRIEEQLPVFEKLGDVSSRAGTLGQIVDLLKARGELDKALIILNEEQLPVFEKLGDVRSRAVTLGRIADIHHTRGKLDEALRILSEEQLPVFEKLGDVRSRAVTLGQIAQIHLARGDLDQALELNGLRRPIAEKLRDIDSLAHIHLLDAQIRLQRGDHEQGALQTIYQDLNTAYEIYVKLDRPDGIAGAGSLLAQVMAMGGLEDEALSVLEAAEAAFRKLGNPQGTAHIAQLRQLIGGGD